MSLTDAKFAAYPCLPWASSAVSTLLIDAAGEKAAHVVFAPKTGNVAQVEFRTGTVTTPQPITLSLQDVDTSGDPDGTADQSGSVASPTSTTLHTVTLGASRAVTLGDPLAVVIEFTSTAGSLSISTCNPGDAAECYSSLYTGTWAKQARSPLVSLIYDDGACYPMPGVLPGNPTQSTYNSGTASGSGGDERGLRFSLPFPARCGGLLWRGQIAAGGDYDAVLYDAASSALASRSLVANRSASTGSHVLHQCLFSSPVDLAANTTYRAAIKPTTATNVSLGIQTVSANSRLGQTPGGTGFILTARTDAGAWTDTNTVQPALALLLDRLDNGITGLRLPRAMNGGYSS